MLIALLPALLRLASGQTASQTACQTPPSWLAQTPNVTYHNPPYPVHGSAVGTANHPDPLDAQALARFNISATKYTWYPGTKFSVNLTCNSPTLSCAYLMTIEKKGQPWGTNASTLLGAWTSVDSNSNVSSVFSARSSGIVFAGAGKRIYPLTWTAPAYGIGDPQIFVDYQFRVETVQFTGSSCTLFYYEVDFPSRVKCGDGFADLLEYCDDGNNVSGDGCSSDCKVEPGYYCGSNAQGKSVCTKTGIRILAADQSTPITAISAADGFYENSIYPYYVGLTTPVVSGKRVIVTITPYANATGNLTVSGINQLIFTEFDSAPKQIILSATNNRFADGTRQFQVRHSVQLTADLDPAYGAAYVPDKNLTVVILDDDTANVNVVSNQASLPATPTKPRLVMNEGMGNTVALYTIFMNLTTEPYGAITLVPDLVPYTLLGEPFNLTIFPSSLTFTKANYTTGGTFRIGSVEDDDCTGNMTFTLNWKLYAPDARDVYYAIYNINQFAVDITVIDDDSPAIFTNATTLSLFENVYADYYRVRLNSRPRTPVQLNLNLSCYMPRGDPPPGFAPCTLVAEALSQQNLPYAVLDRSNWKTGVVMRISVVNNDYNDMTRTGLITHAIVTADPYYTTLNSTVNPGDITLTVLDDDESAILHVPSFDITEGLPPFLFYLNLKSVPYSTVTIEVTRDDLYWFQMSTTEVSWTPAQWNETRVVAVQSTLFDSVDDGTRNANIYIQALSADDKYRADKLAIPFNEYDDDHAGVQLNTGGVVKVTEGQPGAVIPVRLNSQPQGSFTVRIDVTADSSVTVSPSTFTFDTVNWNTYQRLTVTAVDDSIAEGTRYALLQFQLTTQDTQYAKLTPPVVNVTVYDNDFANVTVVVDKQGAIICPSSPCGGAQLVIGPNIVPPGTSLPITVQQVAQPGPTGQRAPVPSFASAFAASGVYSFEPHGTQFSSPVQIALSYDPTTVGPNSGESFAVFRRAGPDSTSWTLMPTATFKDGLASLSVSSFSYYYVGIVTGPQLQAPPPAPTVVKKTEKLNYNFVFWIIVGVAGAALLCCIVGLALLVKARKRQGVAPDTTPVYLKEIPASSGSLNGGNGAVSEQEPLGNGHQDHQQHAGGEQEGVAPGDASLAVYEEPPAPEEAAEGNKTFGALPIAPDNAGGLEDPEAQGGGTGGGRRSSPRTPDQADA